MRLLSLSSKWYFHIGESLDYGLVSYDTSESCRQTSVWEEYTFCETLLTVCETMVL